MNVNFISIILIAFLLSGCHLKETLHSQILADIPKNGILSTNFTIPDSDHVFILVGYRGSNAVVNGELTLLKDNATNTISISSNSPASNWLNSLGMRSVLVTRHSLAGRDPSDYQAGDKCYFSLKLDHAPKSAVVCVGYLK